MTVSTTSSRVVYLGNGSTTVFPFAFKVAQAADLVVVYTDATGADYTLSPSVYSATGFGVDGGGSVTYVPSGAPIATGTRLTIYRDIAITQPTSIDNQGAFWPKVVEAALDRIVMIVQGFIDGMNRGLRISVTDGTTLNELPAVGLRANAYLGFDANGQPTPLAAPSGSTPVSVAMAAVVNQSTLALARTAMGVPGLTGTVDLTGATVTVATVTAGDNDNSAASTAFVQQAIAARTAVADANVAPTDTSRIIAFTSITAARSVNLPAANTITAGRTIDIVDASGSASATKTISLVPNGTDTIAGNNTTQVAINVPRGRCRIVCDGSTGWSVLQWDVVYEAFATADTSLNIANTWIDGTGLSLAQGPVGTWEIEAGIVEVNTGGADTLSTRITDGTNVVVAGVCVSQAANALVTNFVRGRITAPAANLKVQGRGGGAAAMIKANATGNTNKDSYIRARRVA
jgi:hypothetical protein